MDDNLQHESEDSDEGFLEGDIVDNIFNVKGANAHLEMDFELATRASVPEFETAAEISADFAALQPEEGDESVS